jgi:RNA polymerase sigma-54 factor
VRDRIKELIAHENGEVLSDDRIVTLLSAAGVNIARRTVAKYREAMHIPSSVARRRLRYGDEAPAAPERRT